MDGDLAEMLIDIVAASASPIALSMAWQMLRRTILIHSDL